MIRVIPVQNDIFALIDLQSQIFKTILSKNVYGIQSINELILYFILIHRCLLFSSVRLAVFKILERSKLTSIKCQDWMRHSFVAFKPLIRGRNYCKCISTYSQRLRTNWKLLFEPIFLGDVGRRQMWTNEKVWYSWRPDYLSNWIFPIESFQEFSTIVCDSDNTLEWVIRP